VCFDKPVVKQMRKQLEEILETAYYMGKERTHTPSEARALHKEIFALVDKMIDKYKEKAKEQYQQKWEIKREADHWRNFLKPFC